MLLRGAQVVDVVRGAVRKADVALRGGLVAAVGDELAPLRGEEIRDVGGACLLPGLVDAHVHIESAHLVPRRFGEAVLANGTTAAVCDPHEIVNVAGEAGLDFMLEDARASPCDLFFMLPSCVPATGFETPGATLAARDTERLLRLHPELLGLGEMMDVPGVLARRPETMRKIAAALRQGKRVDGHFPLASGEALRRYAAAGMTSDHESVSADEALGKVAAGMAVLIREGSSAKNLEAVVRAVTRENFRSFCFCSDDISALDIVRGGGIIGSLRKAIALGLDPVLAVSIATVNAARHYGLADRGAVEPGLRADLLLVGDLQGFEILAVFKDGRPAGVAAPRRARPLRAASSVRLPAPFSLSFPPPPPGARLANVMEMQPADLVTRRREVPVGELAGAGLARLAVVARHGRGGVAYGLVAGTGLRRGAVAQSISHDTHNVVVLGADDADMRLAVGRLAEMGGGVAVAVEGAVAASLALPYGGLMADLPATEAAAAERVLLAGIRETGFCLPAPVTSIAFLSLAVIPELKLTDRGLVDVAAGAFVPLYF